MPLLQEARRAHKKPRVFSLYPRVPQRAQKYPEQRLRPQHLLGAFPPRKKLFFRDRRDFQGQAILPMRLKYPLPPNADRASGAQETNATRDLSAYAPRLRNPGDSAAAP